MIVLTVFASICGSCLPKANVRGRVTADGKPLPGVLVSDGRQFAQTDSKGRYALLSDKKDSVVFIISPSGYVPSSEDGLRPRFWAALTKPSSKKEVHNFTLRREDQSRYTAILAADLHLTKDPRREDLRRFREIAMPLIDSLASSADGPVYTMNFGDLTHDIYWYEMGFDGEDALEFLREVKYPTLIYSLSGNHDNDGAVTGEDVNWRAAWKYRKIWGPDRYSMNIGSDHWVMLDDIIYINTEGEGKPAPGIKGARDYEEALTPEQLEWLEKDLSYVPDSARVIICMHCPMLASLKKDLVKLPREQVTFVDSLLQRFNGRSLHFAGHVHRFDICRSEEYPSFLQYALPATSGVMWETPIDAPLYAADGTDGGIMTMTSVKGEAPVMRYHTYLYGEKYLRIYDMNEVGKAYASNPGARLQQETFDGSRLDYSLPKYRNWVYVNYWGWVPGQTVEIYEDGKSLEVIKTINEDPMHNFTFDIPRLLNPPPHVHHRSTEHTQHMFRAKASSADKDITVVIKDENGKVVRTETMHRPKPFSLNMK